MSVASPRSTRRKIRLLALLLILLVVVAANRRWLAWLPNYQANNRLAAHRLDDAGWWLKVARRIGGENAESAFIRSRLARKAGDLAQAQKHLERAEKLGLAADRVALERILIRAQSGEVQNARQLLAQLLPSFSSDAPEIYEAYVVGCMNTRTSMRTAIDLLNAWAANHPQAPRPHMLLAELSLEIMDADNAIGELRVALSIDPDNGPAAIALGELLFKRQEYDEAMQLFRTAARSEETRSMALMWQARCLRTFGRTNKARSILASALDEDPDSSFGNLEKARQEIANREFEPAIERLKALLEREPYRHEARRALAKALRSAGRVDEARGQNAAAAEANSALIRAQHLVRDLVLDPDNVELRWEIGRIHFEYGKPQIALQWLQSALKFDAQHEPSRQALAELRESFPELQASGPGQAAQPIEQPPAR